MKESASMMIGKFRSELRGIKMMIFQHKKAGYMQLAGFNKLQEKFAKAKVRKFKNFKNLVFVGSS